MDTIYYTILSWVRGSVAEFGILQQVGTFSQSVYVGKRNEGQFCKEGKKRHLLKEKSWGDKNMDSLNIWSSFVKTRKHR